MNVYSMLSVVFVVAVWAPTRAPTQDRTPAELHIGHVMDSINGTPGRVGLLVTLEEEAEIAARHAGLSVSDPSDLASIQRHTKHVRHAIDPSTEPEGPGKGYGVSKAAAGVETHIKLAAASQGATDKIKQHAVHVSTSARNVVGWSEAVLAQVEIVLAAETAEDAAEAAQKIQELVRQIREGVDDNEDGRVSWERGEGGIAQARQHMELLVQG